MIYIYCEKKDSSRLNYIVNHLFENILNTKAKITDDKDLFLQTTEVCINYSKENLNHGLWIFPHGLLREKGIRKQEKLSTGTWKDLFYLFGQDKGDIPFDIFSASFYILTSYEEYVSDNFDEHGRFLHSESLLYSNNALQVPIVDRWAQSLISVLAEKGYNIQSVPGRKFVSVWTYDIDLPFRYINKSSVKLWGGLFRDLFAGQMKEVKKRLRVMTHRLDDPYFEALKRINFTHEEENKRYTLFVMTGKNSRFDGPKFKYRKDYYQFLNRLSIARIGLHGSYNSSENISMFIKEKDKLEEAISRPVNHNRFHYLRYKIDKTPRILHEVKIEEDFSISFAHTPGFRTGTAIPYFIYDLNNEEELNVVARPSIVMDSTLMYHQGLSPDEGLIIIKKLMDECKQSGGHFISIWHNSNLTGSEKDNPWIRVWKKSLEYGILLEND